jgi:hypothetical protein
MDQSGMNRPETFGEWVDLAVEQLRGWAAARGRRLPTWDRALVAEEENGQRTGRWVSLDEFEPRFQQILRRTTRDWVNPTVDPIEGRALRLVVEYISRTDNAVKVPPSQVSVNLSGPPIAWLETLPAEEQIS